ncbi:MAG: hypothetical protein KDA96_22940 [Planctomycetaceae bacterium]|nr:hypothetical protein [Planctomycetaceae bacterium]
MNFRHLRKVDANIGRLKTSRALCLLACLVLTAGCNDSPPPDQGFRASLESVEALQNAEGRGHYQVDSGDLTAAKPGEYQLIRINGAPLPYINATIEEGAPLVRASFSLLPRDPNEPDEYKRQKSLYVCRMYYSMKGEDGNATEVMREENGYCHNIGGAWYIENIVSGIQMIHMQPESVVIDQVDVVGNPIKYEYQKVSDQPSVIHVPVVPDFSAPGTGPKLPLP